MPVSEGRVKSHVILRPFIQKAFDALEEAGLLRRDQDGNMVGNLTNSLLTEIENYYSHWLARGEDGEMHEIRRDYYALWDYPDKTEWQSQSLCKAGFNFRVLARTEASTK